MPWTSADLTTIDAAIASGLRKVRFSDREMEYASMNELLTARTEIANYLTSVNTSVPVRMIQIYTRDGRQ